MEKKDEVRDDLSKKLQELMDKNCDECDKHAEVERKQKKCWI